MALAPRGLGGNYRQPTVAASWHRATLGESISPGESR
jgi:hypothetical protein